VGAVILAFVENPAAHRFLEPAYREKDHEEM
jgi:hypothetical protein